MKRTALALIIILALSLSAVTGIQLVDLATANFLPITKQLPIPHVTPPNPPTISILSPTNKTYNVDTLPFTFMTMIPQGYTEIAKVYYYIDGVEHFSFLTPNWTTNLVRLSGGTHFVQVSASCRSYEVYNSSVTIDVYGTHYETNVAYSEEASSYSEIYFTVDTPPTITIASPQNKTYESSDVPLDFTVNELVSQITYSLDGQENVTIAGNTTLTGLTYGFHNLTVYAWDKGGNIGASKLIVFDKPEPFPTTLVIAASGASAAVIGIGLLFYFRRRKKL